MKSALDLKAMIDREYRDIMAMTRSATSEDLCKLNVSYGYSVSSPRDVAMRVPIEMMCCDELSEDKGND